jgi:hypothetical protein
MAAKPDVPNIQKSEHVKTNEQSPARVIENPPAKTLAAALANGQKQVDASE